MSLDQHFQKFLKEDNTNPTIPSTGNILDGLNSEEQNHLLLMVNSMLSALTDMPAMNPYYIVERIKTRLKIMLGLSFDDTFFVGEYGSFEKPLYAYNDVVSVYGGMVNPKPDNAWCKLFPHGLTLRVHFLKSGTLFNVNAEVVPSTTPGVAPPISEN